MSRNPRIALIWAQFSAYHVDRLEAVGARLAGRAEILSVEVASRSAVYAWAPSGEVRFTTKVRLFDGLGYEEIFWLRRWWRMLRATWRQDQVYVGIGYNEPDVLLLALCLRMVGVKVIMLTASKWDDRPRSVSFELLKSILLLPFSAALVGGRRQAEYVRFLGYLGRMVRFGSNTVDVKRIQQQASSRNQSGPPLFADRPFVFVGRFVRKKLLDRTIAAYAAYADGAQGRPHRLLMIGSGELEPALGAQAEELGVAHLIDWPGFLDAPDVAASLSRSLALVLVSEEEQWGLVVNEALALGIPVIVSSQIGAREALVRNLENGFVVEPGSIEGLAAAMRAAASNEAEWQVLSAGATERAWLGDAARFADAVELYAFPESAEAQASYAAFDRAISGASPAARLSLID